MYTTRYNLNSITNPFVYVNCPYSQLWAAFTKKHCIRSYETLVSVFAYKAFWKHGSGLASLSTSFYACVYIYNIYQMFFFFHEAPCFPYILLYVSRARSVHRVVSIYTASSVTPETSCQGTVARVTKPNAMESKIAGIYLWFHGNWFPILF